MQRLLVLADTHVAGAASRPVPDEVWDVARTVDLILHAGDVTSRWLLDELGRVAPVRAVLGNNDLELRTVLPEVVQLEVEGLPVAMVHDAGPTQGRAARLRRRFPDAAVVVYGHSHVPDDSAGIDVQRMFNPGSCTQRRRQPHPTYGLLEIDRGRLVDHRVVTLRPPAN